MIVRCRPMNKKEQDTNCKVVNATMVTVYKLFVGFSVWYECEIVL